MLKLRKICVNLRTSIYEHKTRGVSSQITMPDGRINILVYTRNKSRIPSKFIHSLFKSI